MPGQIADDLAAAGGVTDVDGILYIELRPRLRRLIEAA